MKGWRLGFHVRRVVDGCFDPRLTSNGAGPRATSSTLCAASASINWPSFPCLLVRGGFVVAIIVVVTNARACSGYGWCGWWTTSPVPVIPVTKHTLHVECKSGPMTRSKDDLHHLVCSLPQSPSNDPVVGLSPVLFVVAKSVHGLRLDASLVVDSHYLSLPGGLVDLRRTTALAL